MKQTKTARKELTAAYRAVLKHATAVAAGLMISVGTASAYTTESDVNFAGMYNNGTLDATTPIDGATEYGYEYAIPGSTYTTDGADIAPDETLFTYTDPTGNATNLSANNTYTDADYTTDSVILSDTTTYDPSIVSTTQVVNALNDMDITNYSYMGADNTMQTLGESARALTTNATLSTGNIEVDVNTTLDATTYEVSYISTLTGTRVTLWLNPTANGLIDENGVTQVLDPNETAGIAARDAVIQTYNDDTALVAAAQATLAASQATENANWQMAYDAYSADTDAHNDFATWYGELTTAREMLSDANDAQAIALNDLHTAQAAQSDALTVFNTPIQALIDEGATTIAVATVATETERATNAENALDERLTVTEGDVAQNTANIAANAAAITAESVARINGDAETLASAQSYADAGDALTLANAKAYTDAQSAMALQAANDYTDHKVHSLEKELSAGIASATALSSVEVSNVKKGEVSVGGGYGYYNSQSAVAFGAAMGLTDNWSVNAGAGISNSNVAFRAGTNYKFKLF